MSRYPKIHGLLSSGGGTQSYNFGMLYNWYAANNFVLLPDSWKVPTSTEWSTLKTYLTNNGYSGTEGLPLKESGDDWLYSSNGGNNNFANFYAKPSGIRYDNGGYYLARGSAFYWASNQYDANNGYYARLNFDSVDFTTGLTYSKKMGMSIRCIRNTTGTYVYDMDDNQYQTVIIGNQEWITTNLKTTKYDNGNSILLIDPANPAASANDTTVSYNGDSDYITTYGRLYNSGVIDGTNGNIAYLKRNNIQEGGWRVPEEQDFDNLSNYLTSFGPAGNVGGKMKETGPSHWTPTNTNATNTSGFWGLPGGYYYENLGLTIYSGINTKGYFWTTTNGGGYNFVGASLQGTDGLLTKANYTAGYSTGLSIRLMRDVDDIKMIDGDGNYYNTVKIGDQIWSRENLKTTTNGTGSSIAYVTDNTTWNTTTTASRCAYNNTVKNV